MNSVFALNLQEVKNLLWYDGPVISHYRDGEQDYIVIWVDVDIDTDIQYWYSVAISRNNLDAYVFGYISLYEVLKLSTEIYSCVGVFVDEENAAHGTLIQFDDIPKEKLPTKDSFLQSPV